MTADWQTWISKGPNTSTSEMLA
ncbi:rCG57015 [Rattus norvegicus]|uniref:RCG57015 n=1 Tax=Rattus norvegicus TaxID=10116 RepID=A6JD59_RAT|nr:rCG57015 [Rattus norvegicus]